jgi:uncharacterized sulfatase
LPTLVGHPDDQRKHDQLYGEFYEQGSKQAVRQGRFKAVRMPMFSGETQLFDLVSDLGETKNLAAAHPDIVRKMEHVMDEAHVANPNWKVSP